MLKIVLTRLKRVDGAGDIPRPVTRASGEATKTVTKYAIQLQAVVGHEAIFGRPVQRQVLDQRRQGVGENSQLVGTRRSHRPVANNRMKKTTPLSSQKASTPRCHQRARPMEWRSPGRPT